MPMGVGRFHALPPTYFEVFFRYPVSADKGQARATASRPSPNSYSYSYSYSSPVREPGFLASSSGTPCNPSPADLQLLVIQLHSDPRVRERAPLRCVRVRFWVPQGRREQLLRYCCIPPSQRPFATSAFSAGGLPIQARRPFVVARLGLLAESRLPSKPIPTPIVPLPDLPDGPKEPPICSLTHQKGYLVGQPDPWAGSRLAAANLNDDTTAGGIRPASP